MNHSLRIAALALTVTTAAHAQPRSSADVVAWSAQVETTATGTVLVVTGEIADGWRVYAPRSPVGRPLQLLFPTDAAVVAGPAATSPPSTGHDPSTGQTYPYFTHRVRIEAPLRLRRPASRPTHIRGEVSFTACRDDVCLRPSRATIEARLQAE